MSTRGGTYTCSSFVDCNDNHSGQRFLDSSDPRLIRHVASCETAGGESISLPAGKDEKLSREFEGGALIGREATVSSLLDSITNNRHTTPSYYARPLGRGKHCGRFCIRGKDPKTGRTQYRRVNCGAWTCSYCGARKARLAKRSIRAHAERLGLCYFLTLTLADRHFKSPTDRVRHIRKAFNKFREYLKRKYGAPPNFICIMEFTQRGVPHFHVLIDRYIPHAWISKTWDRLGAGKIVFIRRVTIHNVSHYLSKYLTKELLAGAPKGARRITTSRTIKLFPKFKSGITWEFLRESIWSLLVARRAGTWNLQEDLFRFIVLHPDEEGYLKCFEEVADG